MSRSDEGTRSRRSEHRDRLPGSPVGAWCEWRVERCAAQRRRSWGCGAGRVGCASERRAPIGALEEAARHGRRDGPRSRPYGAHCRTDILPGSGRRTPPENRSHSRSSGRERSRAREYRNAGRLGSLARPTRGRRPPWGPPARLSPPTMPRVTVAVSPAGWPRAKMSLPRVTSFAEPRERVRQSGSHWTSMSATSASSSERSTRTGTTRSLSNLARS